MLGNSEPRSAQQLHSDSVLQQALSSQLNITHSSMVHRLISLIVLGWLCSTRHQLTHLTQLTQPKLISTLGVVNESINASLAGISSYNRTVPEFDITWGTLLLNTIQNVCMLSQYCWSLMMEMHCTVSRSLVAWADIFTRAGKLHPQHCYIIHTTITRTLCSHIVYIMEMECNRSNIVLWLIWIERERENIPLIK